MTPDQGVEELRPAKAGRSLPMQLAQVPNMTKSLIAVGRFGIRGRRCLQRGVTSIEYALVASLIAIVIIGSVSATGTSVLGLYEHVSERVQCAVSQNACS